MDDEHDEEEAIEPLEGDPRHFREVFERYVVDLNRRMFDPSYRDEWLRQQCGNCAYFVLLAGQFAEDFGACTNARSPFDRRVMFEHDGCEAYRGSTRWE